MIGRQQKGSNGQVSDVKRFRSQAEVMQYVSRIGARYRKIDEYTGLPLYKNAAGIVVRVNGANAEIMVNCTC